MFDRPLSRGDKSEKEKNWGYLKIISFIAIELVLIKAWRKASFLEGNFKLIQITTTIIPCGDDN